MEIKTQNGVTTDVISKHFGLAPKRLELCSLIACGFLLFFSLFIIGIWGYSIVIWVLAGLSLCVGLAIAAYWMFFRRVNSFRQAALLSVSVGILAIAIPGVFYSAGVSIKGFFPLSVIIISAIARMLKAKFEKNIGE